MKHSIIIAAVAACLVAALPAPVAFAQQQTAPAARKKAPAPKAQKAQSPAAVQRVCEAEVAKIMADGDEEDVWDDDAERAEIEREAMANCVKGRTGAKG